MRPLGPFYSWCDRIRSWFMIGCACVMAFVVIFGPVLCDMRKGEAAFFVVTLAICLAVIWLGKLILDRGYEVVAGTLIGPASLLVVLIGIVLIFSPPAHGRDLGQWETSNPEVREWYRGLMQPDAPNTSCCGEADAYWADEVHVRDGKTFATITDDRDDAPLGRPHVDVGTVIEIPNHKIKFDRGNPTGHGVVFLSRQGFVFCYVQPVQG